MKTENEGDCRTGRARARVEGIDYLRGILALSIVFYHYQSWSHINGGAATELLEKCGIYAVCSFYVLSGLSFGYVYREQHVKPRWAAEFVVKRFMRLAPVYWVAIAGTVTLGIIAQHTGGVYTAPSFGELAANITLTFGVIMPGRYLPTGGWSIGNEVVFYLILPILLILRTRWRSWFYVAIAASLAVGCGFAFGRLRPNVSLADQWETYISPFNHLYLFAFGVAIGTGIGNVRIRGVHAWGLVMLSAAAFIALPSGADQVEISTGWYRMVYSMVSIALCAGCAYAEMWPLGVVREGLDWLGRVSYSVYLLHPVIYGFMSYLLWGFRSPAVVAAMSLPVTLLSARYVYQWVEAPMITIGAKVARIISRGGEGVQVEVSRNVSGVGMSPK